MSNGLKPTKAQLQQNFEILQNTIRSGDADIPRCWAAMERIQRQVAAMDATPSTGSAPQESVR